MTPRPSGETPGPGAGTRPTARPPAAEPSAVPAAAGLGLLSLGGWLLTTTRPWQKPSSSLTLALDWTASGALMLCGLVLLTRCIRTVHGAPDPAYAPSSDSSRPHPDPTGEGPPVQPA